MRQRGAVVCGRLASVHADKCFASLQFVRCFLSFFLRALVPVLLAFAATPMALLLTACNVVWCAFCMCVVTALPQAQHPDSASCHGPGPFV